MKSFLLDPLLKLKEYKTLVNEINSCKDNYSGDLTGDLTGKLTKELAGELTGEMNRYGQKTASPGIWSVSGLCDAARAHFCAAINHHTKQPLLLITYNDLQASRIFDDLSFLTGQFCTYFPQRELFLYDVAAKSREETHARLNSLYRLLSGKAGIAVTSIEAFSHKLVEKQRFLNNIMYFEEGKKTELDKLMEKLVSTGYEREETVEGPGQFAVRGGIIDIFPVNMETAIRIELFDDEIDSVRTLDVRTQRSIERIVSAVVIPAVEMIFEKGDFKRITKEVEEDTEKTAQHLKKAGKEKEADILVRKISNDLERLSYGSHFPGIDRYIRYIARNADSIIDYMPTDTIVVVDEPARARMRMENVLLEHEELLKDLIGKYSIPSGKGSEHFMFEEILETVRQRKVITLTALSRDIVFSGNISSINITNKPTGPYSGNISLLEADLLNWKNKNYVVAVLAGTSSRGKSLSETLAQADINAIYSEEGRQLLEKLVIVTRGNLQRGFEYPGAGFAIVSEKELAGTGKKGRKSSKRSEGLKISTFTDLSTGDYVVHRTHGIGQYMGIQKLDVSGVKKDYLKIRYIGNDYLYIPAGQLDLVQKYIGPDEKQPKINKLGGGEWAKTKAKVKESLKELAIELVGLYARRQAMKGHAFSPDTVWQNQFEEAFPYQETEDQFKCIKEIKEDMERERPMDRLLCGDVGYGKTEVAVRAIFKAVMDSKQVAYLVPTTVLAQQQFTNFKERMKDFPVTVEMISRFRTPQQQKSILKEVKAGNIDVLVGTHRLLQKDLHFKDLGLLVVDEEQRFGVEHKEVLKNLKPEVDVLTLTATPIPRTLHMSMTGIRDISTIEDPPEERYPVQTYVMEYDDGVVRDAISREIARHGQVFYLFNRVRSIEQKAHEISSMLPEIKVAVAHGQMEEKRLEEIMLKFLNRDFDVLVCTTIIESGLDMPNVNTIIIEDADRMGLSQLYQIKGRVGRSNRLAYAYITYKKDKVLQEVAEKRLTAIREFTEFGSGFKIALRDLEIRGAGNLLGPEQHGHMESVGYDMYCRLLDEAVRESGGKGTSNILSGEEKEDTSVDLNVSAYIDELYIRSETVRMEIYRKIALVRNEQDAEEIIEELIDRFGDVPQHVINLVQIALIRSHASDAGFESIVSKDGGIIMSFDKHFSLTPEMFSMLAAKYGRRLLLNAGANPHILFKPQIPVPESLTGRSAGKDGLLESIMILLQDIKSFKKQRR